MMPANAYAALLKLGAAEKPKKSKKAAAPAPSLSLALPVEQAPSPLSLVPPDPLSLAPQLQGRRFLETPARGQFPGDTKINQLGMSQGLSKGRSRNAYMSGDEYAALTDAAAQTAPNQALQGGIDQQEALYQRGEKLPQQVDLSPLMAWADALTGSKFAQSYRAPQTNEERLLMLSGLQDKAQNSKERLAQLLMNETGGMKVGQDEEGYKAGLEEDQKAGSVVPNPHAPRAGQMGGTPTNVRGFYNTFKGSEPVKEAAKIQQAAQAITGHLKNPNWLGDSAARAGILQAMRLAPVSNLDVKQITGSQDLFNQFTQVMGRLEKGDVFTQRDRKTIADYNKYLQAKSKRDLKFAAESYSRAHSPYYGFDFDTGMGLLESSMPRMEDEAPEVAKPPSLFQQIMEKELSK